MKRLCYLGCFLELFYGLVLVHLKEGGYGLAHEFLEAGHAFQGKMFVVGQFIIFLVYHSNSHDTLPS